MAKRAVARRGRSVVALVLLGFVLVATGVIWRRTYGMAKAEQIESLDQKRKELEARRVRLRSEIRDVSSRARIAPIAEQRLHLRVANDSQVINLPRSSIPPAVRRDDPR